VMAEQKVDTWIQNMTSVMLVPPDNTNSTKNTIPTKVKLHSSDDECSSSMLKPLGGIAMPFLQSSMLNALPVTFVALRCHCRNVGSGKDRDGDS
jgi:hypothetical protein